MPADANLPQAYEGSQGPDAEEDFGEVDKVPSLSGSDNLEDRLLGF